MFCSNCGNQLPEEGSFCPSCGKKIIAQSKEGVPKILAASDDSPATGTNFVGLFWLMFAIAAVIALVAYITIASKPEPINQSSPSPTSTPSQTRAPSASSWGTEETVSACQELKPILETNFKKVGTNFSDADSDRALAVILLGVNSAARTYSVNGLFAETSVPLGLLNFSAVIERTIALTFDGTASVLVWTQFVDSLQGDVREPCGQVGVPIILTTE